MGFKDKLLASIWTKIIGWVVVLPAVIIWGWWIYGAEVKARAWTLPVENAEAIKKLVEAEENHQAQYEELKADLSYLKMIWGRAKIQTTGTDEVYAVINTDSPALRFQPGQEIWVTNNSDPGKRKIKLKIKEGGFMDKDTVLLRLSAKAGEELEAEGNEISVGIAIVEPEKEK